MTCVRVVSERVRVSFAVTQNTNLGTTPCDDNVLLAVRYGRDVQPYLRRAQALVAPQSLWGFTNCTLRLPGHSIRQALDALKKAAEKVTERGRVTSAATTSEPASDEGSSANKERVSEVEDKEQSQILLAVGTLISRQPSAAIQVRTCLIDTERIWQHPCCLLQ